MSASFTQSQLEAIAGALGDTEAGLTGAEMAHLLASCSLQDVSPALTKRHRLYNAFATDQNKRGNRTGVLAVIRKAMKPERYIHTPARFEPMRANLNAALAFAGLAVDASGKLGPVEHATTISEAQRRAAELRADLLTRGVHPDVLRFCREELVADNYFHAVLEAVKSVAQKLRDRTGLTDDGAPLVDRALGGDAPLLTINAYSTVSERDEQRGFVNLVKGTFGMFRNPTAHAPRILWTMDKADAEDLLSIVSLVHRRLDAATMPARA